MKFRKFRGQKFGGHNIQFTAPFGLGPGLAGLSLRAIIANDYDANGNVRRTRTSYYSLDTNGAASYQATGEIWFRFDSVNRLVTDKGYLSGVAGNARDRAFPDFAHCFKSSGAARAAAAERYDHDAT